MDYNNLNENEAEALNVQYLPSRTVPNMAAYMENAAIRSATIRGEIGGLIDIPYGDTDLQKVDIFPASMPDAPVFIFIHGGYWRAGDKSLYSEIAPVFNNAGATVVVPNYDLCPDVTIPDIADQIRLCLKWIYENISNYNGDPEQLFLSGHSAGGHLTAMMMATDWATYPDLPRNLLKGAVPISGLFDIMPHRYTDLQSEIQLSREDALRASPQNLDLYCDCPVICAVGGGESASFLRQSREFTEKCVRAGLECTYLTLETDNHFDVTNRLHDPKDMLTLAIIQQMGLHIS